MASNEVPGSAIGGMFRNLRDAVGELFSVAQPDAQRQMHVEVLFALLGYLAKADSIVTSHEAEFVNSLMDELDLSTALRREAMNAFDRGLRRELDIDAEAQRFLDVHPQGSGELDRLHTTLLQLAAADGHLFARERAALQRISTALGIPAHILDVRLHALSAKPD